MSELNTRPVASDSSSESDTAQAPQGVSGRWAIVAGVVALVVLLDQLSKAWAIRRLAPPPLGEGEIIDVIGSLRFLYAENTGMAFSRGASSGFWIALVALAITVVMVYMASKATSRLQVILMGVVIGGALGNLIDRISRADDGPLSGAVVDFIDVQWWPIFNVADAAIVVGGIALVIFGIREPKAKASDGSTPSAEPPSA